MGLKWTGERLTTELDSAFGTFEHLHRYAFSRELCRDKKVLDIASGEGYGTNLLSEVADHVWGVDISGEAVAHAIEKYARQNLKFLQGSATSIPLQDDSVEVVVSFETIEHITEHESFLSEVKRVLKNDGIFIVSTPDKAIYSERDPDNPFHVRELTTDEFRQLIGKYFKFSSLFQQRIFIGSVISSQEKDPGRYAFYDGGFSAIQDDFEQHDFFNKAYFNLILASDRMIEDALVANLSLFSAYKSYERERAEWIDMIEAYQQKIGTIENSKIYKLLSSFTNSPFSYPLRLLRRLMDR